MSRRLLGAVALTALVALALSPLMTSGVSAQTEGPTVTVTPTSGLVDGQAVTVTVKTDSSTAVTKAVAQVCRAGVNYQPKTVAGFDTTPPSDFDQNGANCPGSSSKLSSSSDYSVTDDNTATNAANPEGESFQFRVGTGTSTWNGSAGNVTLTCDDAHPCAMVVELLYKPSGQDRQWRPFVTQLAFGVVDPIAGCGGPADGALATGAADRMDDAWVAWTLAACHRPGAVHGAPSRTSFVGEGSAIAQFGDGSLDVAYTAGGYDKDMAKGSTPDSGLLPADVKQRPAVAVPVAVNAAVLGVYGGVPESGHVVPFKDIKLTDAEAAAMIAGGPDAVGPYKGAINNRNSELPDFLFRTDNTGLQVPVAAYADAEASSWYATRFFKALAPDAWKVPDKPAYQDARGKPRGIDARLALADPSFALSISLVSGQPPLQKALAVASDPNAQGGIWILTDLAVAKDLNLTPVKLSPNESGFVAPTQANVLAALPSMKPDDQGILISDPTKTPAGAYPMTFVEYALVPAEPLVNTDCTLRTNSENLLKDWLTYITGEGQAQLTGGLIPLTADLKAQAAEAIKKVGASPTSCASGAGGATPVAAPTAAAVPDLAIPPPSAALPVPSVGSPLSGLGSGALPSVDTGVGSPLESGGPPADSAGGGGDAADINVRQASAKPPPFAGRQSASWASTSFALLGVIGLSSVAFFVTTKHR